MSKKLDAEKWRVLCEKEELISFMADYAPYAPIRRITGGASKGAYIATLAMSDYQTDKICKAWTLGRAYQQAHWQETNTYTYGYKRKNNGYDVVFSFSAEIAEQYRAEYAEIFACEKPESAVELKPAEPEKRCAAKPKRAPKRKAPNGAFTGWKSNRLGTKQIKVCKW